MAKKARGSRPERDLPLHFLMFYGNFFHMKKDTHPTYYKTVLTCACGNTLETGSTEETLKVEICSQCHPFFTGKQNLIDTAGRVDRFESMKKRTEALKASRQLSATPKKRTKASAKKSGKKA